MYTTFIVGFPLMVGITVPTVDITIVSDTRPWKHYRISISNFCVNTLLSLLKLISTSYIFCARFNSAIDNPLRRIRLFFGMDFRVGCNGFGTKDV